MDTIFLWGRTHEKKIQLQQIKSYKILTLFSTSPTLHYFELIIYSGRQIVGSDYGSHVCF